MEQRHSLSAHCRGNVGLHWGKELCETGNPRKISICHGKSPLDDSAVPQAEEYSSRVFKASLAAFHLPYTTVFPPSAFFSKKSGKIDVVARAPFFSPPTTKRAGAHYTPTVTAVTGMPCAAHTEEGLLNPSYSVKETLAYVAYIRILFLFLRGNLECEPRREKN